MIAYHFPPLAGSSGIQRTLRFVRHLPEFGWEPIVLTTDARAYERTSGDLEAEVPPTVRVSRAFALDTARHLSVFGRYPAFLARPDRWMTWRFAGTAEGRRLIRESAPALLWSTFPIATAHVIGEALHRSSGLPWVADFRDPMAQDGYPEDAKLWQSYAQVEARTVRAARFSVFTAPGAARLYRHRYPNVAERFVVLENGFDEASFAGLSPGATREPLERGAVSLLHSGIVYRSERDPTALFGAVRKLRDAGRLAQRTLRLRFRASENDAMLHELARRFDVADALQCLPPVGYQVALDEMSRADALLVLQAANCNEQIPAKLYEYLRAGRPILGLTDPRGDTAAVLREAGLDTIARLDAPDEIATLLERMLAASAGGALPLPRPDAVARASRRERTRALAALFDDAVAAR